MVNSKRFFAVFAVLMSVMLVLAACGGGTEEKKNKQDNGAAVQTEDPASPTGEVKGTYLDDPDAPKFLSVVSGGTGGTYYPLGGSFANTIGQATGINTKSESSGASVENMNTIQASEGDVVAFTQTDIASYAKNGTMMFEGTPVDKLMAIGTLYPETIQIVTVEGSGIESVADLKGKRVSIGAPGSGTALNAEQILEAYGMTTADIKKQDLSFDDSTGGIQDGQIDAAFVTAGTPTGAVEGLSATKTVKIVPLGQAEIDALIAKYPFYIAEEIPAGVYGLTEPVPTVAVQSMLVVSSEMSETTVYNITQAIFENLDLVAHAKAQLMSSEHAVLGNGIEIHPGAVKYYTEKGITVE
jgi:TRAP transporter TAXI family solute receptor